MKHWQVAALLLVAALSGLCIWAYDLAWMHEGADSWIVALCLPFAWFQGRPWRLRQPLDEQNSLLGMTVLAMTIALVGLTLSIAFFLAAAWTLFVFTLVLTFFVPTNVLSLRRLLPFALFAFPWIVLDGQTIGWFFRYTGAIANEVVFKLIGLEVERSGVYLLVNGIQLRVEAECAGLNNLQAMLMIGGMLAYQKLGSHDGPRYWLAWLLLPALAWIANSIRIFILGSAGVSFGTEFASGWFHDWGGWFTLCCMFGITLVLFRALTPGPNLNVVSRQHSAT